MQLRVRDRFAQLQAIDEKHGLVPWYIIDASQPILEVENNIWTIVDEIGKRVSQGKVVNKMWQEGTYLLFDEDQKEN
jgi:hypothetical protein